MRFVQQAVTRPSRCAVIPHIGSNHPRGYIDTGSELAGFDNHVYCSVVAVEEMARMIDWVPPAAMDELADRVKRAEAKVADLEAQLEDCEKQFQAIDALESAGFRARKKPGRKPKVEEEVAA